MTRNVGVTLTDLAYQVWQGISHGLRSKIVSEFLTENAKELTSLKSPYVNIKKRSVKTRTPEDAIREAFNSDIDYNEDE